MSGIRQTMSTMLLRGPNSLGTRLSATMGLLDFSQMPQHVNVSANHRNEGDCGNDADR